MDTEFDLVDVGDPHVHFRQNKRMKDGAEQETRLLDFSVPQTTSWASFVLPMPNTIPSIRTGSEALVYAQNIRNASPEKMHIIMCIKAIEGFTTPKIIHEAKRFGVDAVKIYFEGVTTNANKGDAVTWNGFYQMIDVWKACEAVDMVVCMHPEKPKVFSLYREYEAGKAIKWLHRMCPNLRISVEHITDRRTIVLIEKLGPNVRGTITGHHLWGDLDMVIGGNLNVHAFCKPPAKTPQDLRALRKAVLSRNPKFMFGSDSAPHPLEDKLYEGCAGCFTGPFCLQLVAHLFEKECASTEDLRELMQGFMGDFARDFYRIPQIGQCVTMTRQPLVIPASMETSTNYVVVPFMTGEKLNWSIAA